MSLVNIPTMLLLLRYICFTHFSLFLSLVRSLILSALLPLQYVPYVGDSKRAMDEYTSEIFMGGKNTIVLHNTCEDSLLAAPIILDLVLLAELSTRIQFKAENEVCMHC